MLLFIFLFLLFKPGACQQHTWFLRIALSTNIGMRVCVCVCLPPRLLITSDVIQTQCNCLNKFYGFYMAVVVGIVSGRGISIHVCRGD